MRQAELIERIKSYNPDSNEAIINQAYVFAMKAHGSQLRASGDPYFSHPIEVASILAEMRMDDASITTALLHDVVEDTLKTNKEIKKIFVSLGFDIIQNGYFNLPKRRYLVIEKLELLLNKIPILRNWLFKSQYLVAKKNPESPLLKRLNLFEAV